MWIFGYGSLVWKVDFPYVKKVIGYIKGYERKFWQASIDHRGVPEKPGRVVTLVPSSNPEAKVWGASYKIHHTDIDRVMQHLDHREVMGYEKVPIEFYPIPNHQLNVLEPASPLDYNNHKYPNSLQAATASKVGTVSGYRREDQEDLQSDNDSNSDEMTMKGRHFTVTMYYGSSENEHYIGPDSTKAMAKQIFGSVGPSGKNKDYLYNLAKVMKQICEEALDPHLAELESAVRDLDTEFNLRRPETPIEL